jgi:hypothetical protein
MAFELHIIVYDSRPHEHVRLIIFEHVGQGPGWQSLTKSISKKNECYTRDETHSLGTMMITIARFSIQLFIALFTARMWNFTWLKRRILCFMTKATIDRIRGIGVLAARTTPILIRTTFFCSRPFHCAMQMKHLVADFTRPNRLITTNSLTRSKR